MRQNDDLSEKKRIGIFKPLSRARKDGKDKKDNKISKDGESDKAALPKVQVQPHGKDGWFYIESDADYDPAWSKAWETGYVRRTCIAFLIISLSVAVFSLQMLYGGIRGSYEEYSSFITMLYCLPVINSLLLAICLIGCPRFVRLFRFCRILTCVSFLLFTMQYIMTAISWIYISKILDATQDLVQ